MFCGFKNAKYVVGRTTHNFRVLKCIDRRLCAPHNSLIDLLSGFKMMICSVGLSRTSFCLENEPAFFTPRTQLTTQSKPAGKPAGWSPPSPVYPFFLLFSSRSGYYHHHSSDQQSSERQKPSEPIYKKENGFTCSDHFFFFLTGPSGNEFNLTLSAPDIKIYWCWRDPSSYLFSLPDEKKRERNKKRKKRKNRWPFWIHRNVTSVKE